MGTWQADSKMALGFFSTPWCSCSWMVFFPSSGQGLQFGPSLWNTIVMKGCHFGHREQWLRLFTAGFSFAHASEISQRLMWYREREREGAGKGEGGREREVSSQESPRLLRTLKSWTQILPKFSFQIKCLPQLIYWLKTSTGPTRDKICLVFQETLWC